MMEEEKELVAEITHNHLNAISSLLYFQECSRMVSVLKGRHHGLEGHSLLLFNVPAIHVRGDFCVKKRLTKS